MILRSMTANQRAQLSELRSIAADDSDASCESNSQYQDDNDESDDAVGPDYESGDEESEMDEIDATIDDVLAMVAIDVADVDADPNLDKTSKAGR